MSKEENTAVVTEVKPVKLGEFKSKRKFLSFISGVNGARVRFNRDIAFLKGEKLSGMLEGAIFKITICDEGTLNFEEVDTTLSDAPMRQRLIDDIDSMDVTGYTQKYVVAGLEFADVDGNKCYLEVEEAKPIDKLRLLFGDDEEVTPNEKAEISERGLSILDQLFGSNDDTTDEVDVEEDIIDEVVEEIKESKLSYMEEQFRKMNEDKITELKSRIEDAQKDIRKYESDIKNAETNKKKVTDSLGILETRLETLTPGDEPNGYVFFVSEQKKNIEGLNDDETKISGKIADLMNLKKDVLVKHLTEGFYKIKIAKKDDFKTKVDKVDKDILEKIDTIDVTGKLSMTDTNEFEYRGELNWHQLVSKMLRKGFEQEPEFDKLAGSNSYESKEEVDETETKVETTTELKGKEVRTFEEKTTLVILGDYNDDSSDFSITDDETGFGVYIGDKEHSTSYESDGFVSILTLDEFKNWRTKIEKEGNDIEDVLGSSFLIPDFKGTIGVVAKTNNEFTTDFDLDDYICHQVDNCYDVYLTLPEGTTIIEMENHVIPLSVLRDLKIDKIIE
jgi:hypothetical protein